MSTYIRYKSNNSGGDWWLDDDDWRQLEAAGWQVEWVAQDPYFSTFADATGHWLGALATAARRYGVTLDEAIAEFERLTGQDTDAQGCRCCGAPHYFYETEDDDT